MVVVVVVVGTYLEREKRGRRENVLVNLHQRFEFWDYRESGGSSNNDETGNMQQWSC